jgi:hypothetical protein
MAALDAKQYQPILPYLSLRVCTKVADTSTIRCASAKVRLRLMLLGNGSDSRAVDALQVTHSAAGHNCLLFA